MLSSVYLYIIFVTLLLCVVLYTFVQRREDEEMMALFWELLVDSLTLTHS